MNDARIEERKKTREETAVRAREEVGDEIAHAAHSS
jgi:hypothetical protein